MDIDRPCPHEEFAGNIDVVRLTENDDTTVTGYSVEITIKCAQCREPFRWIGVPAGLSGKHPTCSPDESELRAPVRPASSDPDFGMGIPGFAITMHSGMETVERDLPPEPPLHPDDHGIIRDWRFDR